MSDKYKVEHEFVIANEFSTIIVRKLITDNGSRLEIIAPKLDRRVQLDAIELESLTGKTLDTFSKLLFS